MLPVHRLLLCSVFAVGLFGRAWHACAQTADLGVITGSSLTDDFCNATFSGFSVSNASRPFIIGPKLEIHLSESVSVEVDAMHREIRTHNTWRTVFSPPVQLPDGTTLSSTSYSTTRTEFAWEFPVMAKYKFAARHMLPFIEAGPSYRPAENRELYGIAAGLEFNQTDSGHDDRHQITNVFIPGDRWTVPSIKCARRDDPFEWNFIVATAVYSSYMGVSDTR